MSLADKTQHSRRPIGASVAILAITGVIALLGDDPVLILACGFVAALAVGLLWRQGEPPVLLLAAGLQLCQVIVRPIYASLTGDRLESVSLLNVGDVTPAIWFALAAMLSLVIGMWCGQLGGRANIHALLQLEARAWSPRSAFLFFLVTVVLAMAFLQLENINEGLAQPAQAAAGIEWVGVFAVAFVCMVQRRGFIYLVLVTLFELLKGLSGFFSDFKEIFFVILVVLVAANPRLKPRVVVACLLLSGVLLTLGAIWSVIKTDYRNYITQNSTQQVIIVPLGERLTYLADRFFGVDEATIRRGFVQMVKRIQYVDFLAATMRNVPAVVPFENGALIGSTIMHVLQPRLLFPDKPPLPSDTQITVRYSGIRVDAGGNAEGTSISLGYVAELYVDLGIIGTLVAMLILGFLFGRSVRYITSSTALPAIVNFGFALMLMMTVTSFEEALIKMIGAFFTVFAAILALRKLLPYLLTKYGPRATFSNRYNPRAI